MLPQAGRLTDVQNRLPVVQELTTDVQERLTDVQNRLAFVQKLITDV